MRETKILEFKETIADTLNLSSNKTERYEIIRFSENERINLFLFAIVGCIVYFYTLSGNTPNPDAVWEGIYYKTAWETEVSLGRFFIPVLQKVFNGTIYAPLLTFLGIIHYCLIGCLINRIFQIRTHFWNAFIHAVILLAPSTWCTLTYYYCGYFYSLSYLAVVFSFYLMIKRCPTNQWKETAAQICIASGLILLSLSIYQAYLPVFITIGIFFLAHRCLLGDSVRRILCFAMKMIAILVLGTGTYLIVNHIVLKGMGIQSNISRGFNTMGQLELSEIPSQIESCFLYCSEYFLGNDFINNSYGWIRRRYINLIFFGVLLIVILMIMAFHKNQKRKLLLCFLACLTPIALMSITIAAPKVSVKSTTGCIMLPTMCYGYVILPVLLKNNLFFSTSDIRRISGWIPRNIIKGAVIACRCSCILVIGLLIGLAIDGQVYMNLRTIKTYAVASQIINKLEEMNHGSFENKVVMIVGTMENGNYPEEYPALAGSVHWTTAQYGTLWPDYGAQVPWRNFAMQYLGTGWQVIDDYNDYVAVRDTDEFQRMSFFPDDDSVQEINNVIVVKLSNEE